jgi:microcin C transport system permease protein
MGAYILRRLLLIVPTIVGIMAINFAIIQFAPGGPVERVIAQLQGTDVSATARISGGGSDFAGSGAESSGGDAAVGSKYRGAQGLDPEFIAKDLEASVRFRQAAARAIRHDDVELCPLRFRRELLPRHRGDRPDSRKDAGLDLARAVDDADFLLDLHSARHPQGGQDGSRFDVWTSAVIIVGYAIPGFPSPSC